MRDGPWRPAPGKAVWTHAVDLRLCVRGLEAVASPVRSAAGQKTQCAESAWLRHARCRLEETDLPEIVGGATPRQALSGRGTGLHVDCSSFASMAAVRLPDMPGVAKTSAAAQELRSRLRHEHAVEAPVAAWEGALWVRVSAAMYNTVADFEALATAVVAAGERAGADRGMTSLPSIRAIADRTLSPLPSMRAVAANSLSPLPSMRTVTEHAVSPLPSMPSATDHALSPMPSMQTVVERATSPLPLMRSATDGTLSPLPSMRGVAERSLSPLPSMCGDAERSLSPLPSMRGEEGSTLSPLPSMRTMDRVVRRGRSQRDEALTDALVGDGTDASADMASLLFEVEEETGKLTMEAGGSETDEDGMLEQTFSAVDQMKSVGDSLRQHVLGGVTKGVAHEGEESEGPWPVGVDLVADEAGVKLNLSTVH